MKKRSKLKICVLGGINFGKTSLLYSMQQVGGDQNAGIMIVGNKSDMLNTYNKSNRTKNEIKKQMHDTGKPEPSDWSDMCNFCYNLTGNGNKKYQLTFIDYPGEFFNKYFSDSNTFLSNFLSMLNVQKKGQKAKNTDNTFTRNDEKSAKRLAKELRQADAFIILLPADIKEDRYKSNCEEFCQRLQMLLEKIHAFNPYIPFCLAINKWDMFDKAYDALSDVLQEDPYKEVNNMLTRECGEYYFCLAVSAFGKYRSVKNEQNVMLKIKGEWDRKSTPVNVMQMLLKISEAAEKSRYLHLREKYKNATILSKILHFPAVFASHYRKGANAEEDRNFCTKGFTRCISAFLGTIVSIVVLCFVFAGTLTTLGEFAYLKIQGSNIAEIEKSFEASKTDNTSADKILKLKENLSGHPLKLAFFCKTQVDALSARITEIEHQYNLRIWQNAIAFCDDNRNKDENPQKLKSEKRKERCRNRIEHLKAEQEKLTDLSTRNSDGRAVKDCFAQKIEQENRLLDNIGEDGSLDDALYALTMTKDEEKCRAIESLIDQYESTNSYRKNDFDNLREQLNALEKSYHDKLLVDLEEIKDFVSKDFDRRISLAQQRIVRIKQEKQYLSNRSKWHNGNDQMISAEEQNIKNWQHDNKFYVAFNAAMKPGDDQIQRLVGFLNTYKKESYSRCVADWDVADKKKNELIAAVNENLENTIKKNSIDVKDIRADERERRINIIINACQDAKGTNPTQTSEYDKKIADLNLLLQQVQQDEIFEKDYANAMKPGDDQIQRLVDFLKKYQKSPSDRYTADWDKADKKKNELIAAVNKNLENIIKNNSIDVKDIRADERERRIGIIIDACKKAKVTNPTQISEYDQKIAALTLQLQQVKQDKIFETDYDNAMKAGNDQIQRLVDFLKEYPKAPSTRYTADWDVAEKKKNDLIVAVNDNLQKILSENSVTETKITAVKKVERLQNCINAYKQAKKENPTETEKYDAEIATLKRNLAVAEKDTEFEAEYNKILASADNGKLMHINSFITSGEFAQVNFPHKGTEYAILENEKARLLNKWNKEQEEARKRYPDDAKQRRATRLKNAEKLLTEYNRLLNEYLPASTEYDSLNRCIQELKGKIDEHKKYKKLIDEFDKIKTQSDNSFIIVGEIVAFGRDFKASDYPAQDGIDVFKELDSLRKQHNEVVVKKFEESEKKFEKPADNEFARLAEYYQKLRQNVDTFMQKISKDIPFYKDLQNLKNMYGNNIKKYQRFAKITAELKPLISDDGQKSDKDAMNRLNAIKAFYANEDFSKELASEPELEHFSKSLKKMQNGVEKFIDRKLSKKLEEISEKLPKGAAPQDQIDNWKKQLDLIDGFCSSMIQSNDNALYRKFSTKRRDLYNRLGKKKLRTRFDGERSKLDSQLESGLNVTDKIALIGDFIDKYSHLADFKDEISSYKSMRNDYDQRRKFYSFEQECNTLISKKPSNAAGFNDLTEYRDDIRKKLDIIKKFEGFSGVQQDVENLKKGLSEEINYVNKAIGDGSWHDICEKEKEYKNNPTKRTYDSLKNAIDGFDAKEYSSYEGLVKEIKRKLQNDWKQRTDIKDAWKQLKTNKNGDSLKKFNTACEKADFWCFGAPNYLVKADYKFASTSDLSFYMSNYNELKTTPKLFNATLKKVSSIGRLGSDSGERVHIKLLLKGDIILRMAFPSSFQSSEWNNDGKHWNRIYEGSLQFNLQKSADMILEFQVESWEYEPKYEPFDNEKPTKKHGDTTIKFHMLEIFIPLMIDGKDEIELTKKGDNGVALTFRFSKQ